MRSLSNQSLLAHAWTSCSVLAWMLGATLGFVCVNARAGEWIPPVAGLQPGPRAQCGPRSLYAAARLLGRDVRYQDVLNTCRLSAEGCSLASLRESAMMAGLYAVPVSTNRVGLCSLLRDSDQRLVAICHQKTRDDNDHFVVWYAEPDGGFCLLNWINPAARNMTEKGLTDYTGAALLVSDSKLDVETVEELAALQADRQRSGRVVLGMCLVVGIALGWFLNSIGIASGSREISRPGVAG